MEIPVIDFSKIDGESRSKILALLHQACEKWGCFMIENHNIDKDLMAKMKAVVNRHYEDNLKEGFYKEMVKSLNETEDTRYMDWESAFFVWHRPESNINKLPNLSVEFKETMDEYIDKLIKLAEHLSELMSENLGLEKNYIKQAFSGSKGPSALWEQKLQNTLIVHILNRIFVNTGDQLEVLSNGRYKSALHRVMTDKKGSRLSVATFYNPAGDAIISPASKLLYPEGFSFQDYLKIYAETKFADKIPRFEESMKKSTDAPQKLLV